MAKKSFQRVPRWVATSHQRHVKKFSGKPQFNCWARAEGHGLTMVEVTTVEFACQCGEIVKKPKRTTRKSTI